MKKPSRPKKGLTISVIVPAYNEEKLIGRTLSNIKNVLPEAQLIIADGYSKDSTVKIARKFGRVVFEKEHTVGGARNSGAALAKGDILLFVDADTFPGKEFVDAMLAEFSDPGVVGVGCQVMPERIGMLDELFFRFLNLMILCTFVAGKPTVAGSCVAYRKTAFRKSGGFDAQTRSAEDFDLCLRMSRLGRVSFLFHQTVLTSNRRLKSLGALGLVKDWVKVTAMFLSNRKTSSYYAPR